MCLAIEKIDRLMLRYVFATVDLCNHLVPVLLFNESLSPTMAVAGLIGRQVAKAVVFKVQGYLKLFEMPIRHLDLVAFKSQLGRSL